MNQAPSASDRIALNGAIVRVERGPNARVALAPFPAERPITGARRAGAEGSPSHHSRSGLRGIALPNVLQSCRRSARAKSIPNFRAGRVRYQRKASSRGAL